MGREGPTDWFRVRHVEPFSETAIAALEAGCAIFRARIEATLQQWAAIPSLARIAKPRITFFPVEVSSDRRVLSLPVRVEGQTIGSRSLLQTSAAGEIHMHLPPPVLMEVELGVTEPAFDGSEGWRNDWWDPWAPSSGPPPEVLKEIREHGGRIVSADDLPDLLAPVRGWAWLKRRICRRLIRWCRDA